VRTPERYIDAVNDGSDPVAGDEVLDERTRLEERFALSLRTREGAIVPSAARAEADRLIAGGFLENVGGRVVMTRTGRMLGTDLTARLLAAFERAPRGARSQPVRSSSLLSAETPAGTR
jgi:coproporphyrinogen III oxidase-like Fe-S oxidoreductase